MLSFLKDLTLGCTLHLPENLGLFHSPRGLAPILSADSVCGFLTASYVLRLNVLPVSRQGVCVRTMTPADNCTVVRLRVEPHQAEIGMSSENCHQSH